MFSLLTAAIAPAIGLLTYFYLKTDYRRKLHETIIRTFLIGILLVFPVMVLQYAFIEEEVFSQDWLQALILYGFTEEFFKWFILFIFAYQHGTIVRRNDGIVYGVSLSLGFATMENIFYLIAHGIETAVGRALMPVSSHALFGIIMGYYMSNAKLIPAKKRWYLALSLILPITLHSSYDYIVFLFDHYVLFGIIPFMLMLWAFAIYKIKLARRQDQQSPRIRRN
ncbi:glutamic-type intramembrane protease PrsW [Alkalicoccobacillus murimartini]|uniref:Protease PrsW n=1 Tax=Alkalicoccobacillus murimartini TaxID=171685 RepID=A0ABT9YDI7_9BACI|nr:glutamic-type intramembrane protease PrsW [Alkalicoccobacillus murimartini]MDQ0205892.1 RsiW-degrading membrane proteinase PrsW (M82 family) [Alkalicoccobacillus murimartini]